MTFPRKSGQELYNYLKGRVFKGRMGVPVTPGLSLGFDSSSLMQNYRGLTIRTLKDTAEERKLAKDYMIETFYKKAPVPSSLNLAGGEGTIMHRELELLVDASPVSLLFSDAYTDELAAVGLNCLFRVDPQHPRFSVDALEWLNIGGQIANELAETDAQAADIWRDYQYQLQYHLMQTECLRRGDKDVILYSGMQHTEDKFRERHLSTHMIRILIQNLPPNCYNAFAGTFPGFRILFKKYFGSFVEELAYVPYSGLTFERGGRRIFGNLQDGICFMATINATSNEE